MMSGIDLRRGQFRRSSSDEDLARVIRAACRRPACRPSRCSRRSSPASSPSSAPGSIARPAPSRVGDAGARARALRRQGRVRHLPPRERPRQPRSRPTSATSALARTAGALQRTLLDPVVRDDADQPARAHRHEGWPDDRRPPAERGHLHRADDRRPASSSCRSRRATCARLTSRRGRRCRRMPEQLDAGGNRRRDRVPAYAEGSNSHDDIVRATSRLSLDAACCLGAVDAQVTLRPPAARRGRAAELADLLGRLLSQRYSR